jgi:hypothetical protein
MKLHSCAPPSLQKRKRPTRGPSRIGLLVSSRAVPPEDRDAVVHLSRRRTKMRVPNPTPAPHRQDSQPDVHQGQLDACSEGLTAKPEPQATLDAMATEKGVQS